MRIYDSLTVIEYEKPQSEHGYKYLIKDVITGVDAYRTDKGFKFFLKSRNVSLSLHDTIKAPDESTVKIHRVIGKVQEQLFWEMSQLPKEAKVFKGLSNGSLVDCYYYHVAGGSIIFRPNANAKEVYKPLPTPEHIEFQRVNG